MQTPKDVKREHGDGLYVKSSVVGIDAKKKREGSNPSLPTFDGQVVCNGSTFLCGTSREIPIIFHFQIELLYVSYWERVNIIKSGCSSAW